ncbi:MAG: FtsH protease activity modulator HflK [Betaproteobacteria bacterium]
MNSQTTPKTTGTWRSRVLGAFNLNDGRWGRDESSQNKPDIHNSTPPEENKPPQQPPPNNNRPTGNGPPDLDELWRDFNKKLSGFFGSPKKGGGGGEPPVGGKPPSLNFNIGKYGISAIFAVIVAIWLSTGFFIVQEGQQGVITQFGRYHSTVGAGFNWRMPYPFQRQELVFVTQIRSVDVGRENIVKATGLRESAMLTEDENILEIKFAVQYRLTDARAYLFETKNPTDTVIQAAETAVREVVGKMKMDAAMSDERDQIGPRIRVIMQRILDQYKVGIEVVGINLQQGGVRPPEQVQSAFDDVLKAGQERERAKNEAEAYANDVIPRAVGAASRLKQEADGYKSRIVAQAQGDAQRFKSLVTEYQKAPQVMRDRMYIDAMQQIYSNTTKLLIDAKAGSNLLYLPLDKIIQQAGASNPAASSQPVAPLTEPSGNPVSPNSPIDARSRDGRSRDRDSR